jgi:CheY-like chemotaxis protein
MAGKILIVEDNPQNMKVVMMVLRPYGYTLLQAADGEQALEVAQKDHPDLIIMDIQLPKINGLEVTRRLRQNPAFQKTPIVAVTAYAMKGDEDKAIQAGCDGYLPKPINTRQLPGIVAEYLSRNRPQAN